MATDCLGNVCREWLRVADQFRRVDTWCGLSSNAEASLRSCVSGEASSRTGPAIKAPMQVVPTRIGLASKQSAAPFGWGCGAVRLSRMVLMSAENRADDRRTPSTSPGPTGTTANLPCVSQMNVHQSVASEAMSWSAFKSARSRRSSIARPGLSGVSVKSEPVNEPSRV